MAIQLFDTWTRSTRELVPQLEGHVSLYTCGPTVYDYQHIGNYRTFLFEDGLKRVLKLNGLQVHHVMNITDVGHLVSDADDGEDKMEKGSRRTGQTAWDIAALFTEAFLGDLQLLGIEAADTVCRATDHIAEQIAFIEAIERKGFVYQTSDGVYFDTSKQPSYGYLGRLDKCGLHSGARVDMGEKRNPTDYALWKFSQPEDHRQMEWDSPWGRGFPGWHIECSAMAHKYLGEYFDIHCGGEDHITVHHPNEISQTEAAFGTRLANFWMHGHFLLTNDGKMSKSAGEFLRVQLLVDKGYDPLAYRYLCLTAHYRSQLNFTWEALDAASTALSRLRSSVHALAAAADGTPDAGRCAAFLARLNEDLNFPQALAVLWETVKSPLADADKRATLLWFDQALGLGLAQWQPIVQTAPAQVAELAAVRWQAKADKRWADADSLRQDIFAAGWEMKDGKDGYSLAPR